MLQDLLLWCTMEFGYLRLGDGFVQSSSIMPQKRNPVALEHARAIGSKAVGQAQAIMTAVHNTPFGDIVDTEDDLQPLVASMFRDATRTRDAGGGGACASADFDVERLAARAGEGGTTLTELADTLVRDARAAVPHRARHRRAAAESARRAHPQAPLSAALAQASRALIGRSIDYSEERLRAHHEPAALRRGAPHAGRAGARGDRARALAVSRARRSPAIARAWQKPPRSISRAARTVSSPQRRRASLMSDVRKHYAARGRRAGCSRSSARSTVLPAVFQLTSAMHSIDWTILIAYLVWIVWQRRCADEESERARRLLPRRAGACRGGRSGLSVMATQLSAITMIGTTGQGYADGMRFIQFYFALPLAMVILSVTLVPFFHRAQVFTAYEYLERRFDAKTRSLTALAVPDLARRCRAARSSRRRPSSSPSIIGWNITLDRVC